jgi:tetratricopeptide (TPR) repeat protein
MNAVGRSIHVHRVSCGHRAGDRARPDGTGGHARGCAGERGGPWRASVVREYGLALVGRAEADENTADLRDGVRLLTESLGLLADHAQALAETRTALGVAIVRAAYRGLPEADPDLAIRLLTPGPPEDTEDPARRGARLDTAGLAFVLRGRRQGSPGDLDRGIDHYVRALRTHPRSAPGRARTTFNLAMALQERYGQRGDLSDLDAACGHLDRLIADLDPRSPEWREAQLARSECVMSRPPGRQDREEFDAGIALSRQQTEELPAGHPLRPQYLNNLIKALLLRFGRYQDAADARRAAELAVSMVESLPDDHAERAVLLTSAAVAVWAGGQPAGMSDQRSRILAYLREAVQASRAADPQRGRRLAALGVALLTPPGHRASDPLPMPPPGITAGERDQAIDYLNQAADLLAETPGRQLAASVLIVLARLRRARGDRSRDDHGQARQAAARRHDRRQRGGPPARRRRARAGAGMVPGGDERRG